MTNRHVLASFVVIAAAGVTSCKAPPVVDSGSGAKTDLVDNEAVSAEFEGWKAGASHCQAASGRKKAIITGFAKFGDPYNFSAIAAMSLAKTSFFPSKIDLSTAGSTPTDDPWSHPTGKTTVNGGFVQQRTLEIDGESFEVCFLYLEVKWDLAAAIILHESSIFQPDLVVMGGYTSRSPRAALFESGALNSAGTLEGADEEGKPLLSNKPLRTAAPTPIPTEAPEQSDELESFDPEEGTQDGTQPTTSPTATPDLGTKILPDLDLGAKVLLSWNAAGLVTANTALLAAIPGKYTAVVGEPRTTNNYVCNNVSIAVQTGLSGQTVKLAGDKITIPGQSFGTKVGFLHYPGETINADVVADRASVFGWTKVLANTIKFSIGNGSSPAAQPESDVPSSIPTIGPDEPVEP